MRTPNLTQAQWSSALAALVAIIAAVQGADERLQVPLLVVIGAVAVALIVSDAVIRHGRSRIEAARVSSAPALPPDALDAAIVETVKLAADARLADGDDSAHAPQAG